MLFGNGEGLALVFALARAMVVLAEELVALAVDPLLLAVGLERAEGSPGLDVVRVLVRAAPGLVVVRRHGREVVRGARAGVQASRRGRWSAASALRRRRGRRRRARGGARRRRGRVARREGAPTEASLYAWGRGQQAPWAARSSVGSKWIVSLARAAPQNSHGSSRQLL